MVDSRQANIDQHSLFDMSRLTAPQLIWRKTSGLWMLDVSRRVKRREANSYDGLIMYTITKAEGP